MRGNRRRLGGGYDPASNLLFVPSTEECGIWKVDAKPPVNVSGQAYKGGALPKRGRLGATPTVINSTQGQVARATSPNAAAGETAESIGDAPFTADQVTQGAAVYTQHCPVCHGAQLQGVAAPAMAGPAFARTKPTLAQLHTVVTKNMPLTAPGTLPATDYAAIMAYMLSYQCVKPSGDGKTPFPTGDISLLKPITFGAKVCPPGGGKE